MSSVTQQLKDLADLVREGFITREEFEQQKRRLLAGQPATGAESPPSPKPVLPPDTVGPTLGAYRILGEIGQGGMGVVYRARHGSEEFAARQGGDVALKVLHAQYAARPELVARFEREAELGIKLDHPGIIRVHQLIRDGGRLALVMALAEGRPLSRMIGTETGPIPWERAWPMFEQLLDAVGHAHGQGVVHRDLKPENIMVGSDGRMVVLDFGIAKEIDSNRTQTGTGMGTIDYMAPEQYTDAKNVDHRADIYALGMTFYEMLAGRLPWEPTESEFAVMTRKQSGDIPCPTTFYPEIPAHVVTAIGRATEASYGNRFSSIRDFRTSLTVESSLRWNDSRSSAMCIEDRATKATTAAPSISESIPISEDRNQYHIPSEPSEFPFRPCSWDGTKDYGMDLPSFDARLGERGLQKVLSKLATSFLWLRVDGHSGLLDASNLDQAIIAFDQVDKEPCRQYLRRWKEHIGFPSNQKRTRRERLLESMVDEMIVRSVDTALYIRCAKMRGNFIVLMAYETPDLEIVALHQKVIRKRSSNPMNRESIISALVRKNTTYHAGSPRANADALAKSARAIPFMTGSGLTEGFLFFLLLFLLGAMCVG